MGGEGGVGVSEEVAGRHALELRGGGWRVAETAKSNGGFAPESGKRQKVMEGLPRSMENVRK